MTTHCCIVEIFCSFNLNNVWIQIGFTSDEKYYILVLNWIALIVLFKSLEFKKAEWDAYAILISASLHLYFFFFMIDMLCLSGILWNLRVVNSKIRKFQVCISRSRSPAYFCSISSCPSFELEAHWHSVL